MIYYSADPHFGHQNIIKFCNRPFASVDEMDDEIIRRYNSRVTDADDLYIIGDFSFRNAKSVGSYLERLNGRKHLIWGNHDTHQVKNHPSWSTSQPYLELNDQGENVVLFHYAMRSWNKSFYGSYHLFGHTHGKLPSHGRSLDVGVDCWGFQPVTLAEIKARLGNAGGLGV